VKGGSSSVVGLSMAFASAASDDNHPPADDTIPPKADVIVRPIISRLPLSMDIAFVVPSMQAFKECAT
jgi:hypothetical protein